MVKNRKPSQEVKKGPRSQSNVGGGLLKRIGAVVFALSVFLLAHFLFSIERNYDDQGFLPALPSNLRPPRCDRSSKRSAKDDVSIIIPYYKEALFRIDITMRSILRNTNMKLIKEIIWVSDGNGPEQIFEEQLLAKHPKVKVHINSENKGLIVTKMEAAVRASGSILMFLEPHVVVAPNWLEPLLTRIADQPKALVMPTLDVLNEDMSRYRLMALGYWRFEWNLNLVFVSPWHTNRRKEVDRPFPSPGTSGGIYAIRKEWWDHLEFFDPELIRWGGDHIEASHKVWRCGGRVEIHPCSRVGHWFRFEQHRPYEVSVPDVIRNYKRLAEVWLDDHKESFYKVKPEARPMEFGNVSDMRKFRERLKCEDMDWYLQNVDVELAWEESRACIPGASKEIGGCNASTPAPTRSTIDQIMPREELIKAWEALPGINLQGKQEL